MDEVKYGEILLPGDEDTQSRREKTVRQKFWPTFRRAVRQIPFSRDVVAGFYCALDPQTPTKAVSMKDVAEMKAEFTLV